MFIHVLNTSGWHTLNKFFIFVSTAVSASDVIMKVQLLSYFKINPLNAELNATCHMLAVLGAHHILHVSRIRVIPGTEYFGLL